MKAQTPRPLLKDQRRAFFWADNSLIDFGAIVHLGASAWAVYTCLLRHASQEAVCFPSVKLLEAETGLSNRVIAKGVGLLKAARLIGVERGVEGMDARQNVYLILDVEAAIKKNGWKRVEKDAPVKKTAPKRDEKAVGDEKSRNNVTKGHTKKTQGNKTQVPARKAGPGKPPVAKKTGEVPAPPSVPLAEQSAHELMCAAIARVCGLDWDSATLTDRERGPVLQASAALRKATASPADVEHIAQAVRDPNGEDGWRFTRNPALRVTPAQLVKHCSRGLERARVGRNKVAAAVKTGLSGNDKIAIGKLADIVLQGECRAEELVTHFPEGHFGGVDRVIAGLQARGVDVIAEVQRRIEGLARAGV